MKLYQGQVYLHELIIENIIFLYGKCLLFSNALLNCLAMNDGLFLNAPQPNADKIK